VYHDGVLLADGELVANGRRYLASLVVFKLGVDDGIGRIYNNLCVLATFYFLLEIEFFLEIDFSLNLVVFNLVVEDTVLDVFLLQVKSKAAVLACFGSFHRYLAAFVKRTGGDTDTVLLVVLGEDVDLFIESDDLVFDLGTHCEIYLLILAG